MFFKRGNILFRLQTLSFKLFIFRLKQLKVLFKQGNALVGHIAEYVIFSFDFGKSFVCLVFCGRQFFAQSIAVFVQREQPFDKLESFGRRTLYELSELSLRQSNAFSEIFCAKTEDTLHPGINARGIVGNTSFPVAVILIQHCLSEAVFLFYGALHPVDNALPAQKNVKRELYFCLVAVIVYYVCLLFAPVYVAVKGKVDAVEYCTFAAARIAEYAEKAGCCQSFKIYRGGRRKAVHSVKNKSERFHASSVSSRNSALSFSSGATP